MRLRNTVTVVFALVLGTAVGVFGQATVNVSPGDDIQTALQTAGSGGTVIFAPGWYDVMPLDGSDTAFDLGDDLYGITLRGAGMGLDPTTATIIDGEAGYIQTAVNVETDEVIVEGFTFIHIAGEAIMVEEGERINIEINSCMLLAVDSAIEVDDAAGFWLEDEPDNYTDMVRLINCVLARGGDDGCDIEDNSALVFLNCDFYDFDSDLIDITDDAYGLYRNCNFHAGEHSDDLLTEDNAYAELFNCVFFDPPDPGGMDISGVVIDIDGTEADPMYVNVGSDVPYLELDFHLQTGSPALTAGIDADGNPTFTGALGPAQ